MDDEILLRVVSPKLQYIGRSLATPHPFAVKRGRTHIIFGENGAGKSTLARVLERGWNIGMNRIEGDRDTLNIKYIEFSDIHTLTGCPDSYYQQRFESTASDGIPIIGDIIKDRFSPERWNQLCRQLSIADILDKRVNYLSSGELRKFLLINLFAGSSERDAKTPDILIVDNPYIGLDTASRQLLDDMLASLAHGGTALVLLLCDTADIPPYADELLPVKDMHVGEMTPATADNISRLDDLFEPKGGLDLMPDTSLKEPIDFTTAFELDHCVVRYGPSVILDDVSWRVEAGERWALLGENGSGKSTLLSLVSADNPQSYSNRVTIFDRRRGTGESIWDIKRRIGYISAEMHLYFDTADDVATVVANGLRDTVGCFGRVDEAMASRATQWLRALGIEHLADKPLRALSSGEQRLALIARTLIKPVPLLILDEPLHGLDQCRKSLVTTMIGRMMDNCPGRAMVYVTHYEREIPPAVTRIFRLPRPGSR